jgi:hypothetical protein
MMLSHHANCHYAECHILFIVMLKIVMLSVVMLNIVMVSVVAPIRYMGKLVALTANIRLSCKDFAETNYQADFARVLAMKKTGL